MPGNSIRQQTLRELLNSGADVDLESGDFHPNDVATLLKTFLGELPEPLLTHRHFHAHLKIAGMNTSTHSHSFIHCSHYGAKLLDDTKIYFFMCWLTF